MNIGIVGHGFVGKAVDYGFSSTLCSKHIVDPSYKIDISTLKGLDLDVTFVCVPTPMSNDGSIDSSIIESVVSYLKDNVSGLIIIKSTVTPDIILKLGKNCDRLVYNPEFLTEKSANEDFVNPSFHVFGGAPENTDKVETLYKHYSLCKPCPSYHMSLVDASFVKYGINCFLATKVLWFNQFFDIVEKSNGNFGKIVSAITADNRIGKSHTVVPGFDNKRGFGGACFPKDTLAFAEYSKNFSVLNEVIEKNNAYRNKYERDDREIQQNVDYSLKK